MSIDAGSIIYTIDANTSGLLSAEGSVNRSSKRIIGALSRIASGVSLGLLVKQLVSVQREFDKLNAAILTSTGSVDKAGVAFKALERFAAETPFALKQSVEAFTKLVNFGLTPSERAMKSFGDTSAALGKDLTQMIEAVADAATGEFERLKEFGIKSKNQGDTIAFTFRGITTVVKNSAAEIENFLIELGENNFAGAMANRMATLDGAISNLEDSWDGLLRTVSAQGPGSIIQKGVRSATEAIEELIKLLQSGELNGIMDTIANSWRMSFINISTLVSNLTTFILSEFDVIREEGASTSGFLSDAFFNFPANVKAAVQIAAVEIASFVDKAKALSRQLAIDLNPFSDEPATLLDDFKRIESAASSTINDILKTRDKSIKKINQEREAVAALRAEFDATIVANKKAAEGVDVLAQFKVVVPKGTVEPDDAGTKREKARISKGVRTLGLTPLQELEKNQKEEIELLRLGFEQKEFLEAEFLTRSTELNRQHQEQLQDLNKKTTEESIVNWGSIQDQSASALTSIITGAQTGREAMSALAQSVLTQMIGALIQMGIQAVIGQTTAAAAGVATAATLATAYAPAAALASLASFGANAAPAAAGIASTVGLAQTLSLAGAREHGGPVSAGKSFLVGERGPEIFTPGAGGNVTSNKESFGGTTLNVMVENNTPSQVSTQLSDNGKQLKIIINEVARQINTNQGVIPKAMRQSTNTTFKTSR